MSSSNPFVKSQRNVKSSKVLLRVQIYLGRILLFFLLAAVAIPSAVAVVSAAPLFVPALVATKTDTLINDGPGGVSPDDDGDNKADPGETIEYTVAITNSGTDATGVVYTDTIDANTTLVPGSVAASPVAVNDTLPVTVTGNLAISTTLMATPFSVITNDFQGLNMSPGLTISAYNATSVQGGQVTMITSGANIGRFSYDPPTGYEGTDTFSYTLSDNTNAASPATNRTATVTINISGMIWFVNNNTPTTCITNGCGRLSNPYSALAAFNTANDGTDIGISHHPAANDNIFIYESAIAYTGTITGVTLLSGQKLIGQDSTQTLSAITGLSPVQGSLTLPAMNTGAPATVIQNGSGDAITLNEGNTIRGLTISGTSGAGILGLNRNALTVGADVATSGVAGADLSLNGGNGTVSFGASVTNTAGRSISIINRTGGTATLTGPINDTGTGVFLDNNDNATVTIAGGLVVNSGTNAAFTATNGGTVNVCDENPCNPAATGGLVNTLTTTSGTALNVANTNIGANNLEFRSISSNGGTGNGIILDTTGSSGGLKVVGDGTNTSVGGNSSGGTIANKIGADGNNSQGIGIYLNNTSNVVLRRITINGINQNFGIRGFAVNNFTLEYSTIGSSTPTVAGSIAANLQGTAIGGIGEGAIYFGNQTDGVLGLTGIGTFTSNNISAGRSDNMQLSNGGGTLNRLNITGSTFGYNSVALPTANAALTVVARRAASGNTILNSTVTGNTFVGSPGNAANFTGQEPTTSLGISMDTIFQNNTISNNHANNNIGGSNITVAGFSNTTFNVSNNTMSGANGSAITLQLGAPVGGSTVATSLNGTVNNNTIGVSGVVGSGSGSGNGIFFSFADNATAPKGQVTLAVTNNQIYGYSGNAAIFADNTGGSYNVDLTVTGNVAGTPGVGAFAGYAMAAGAPSSSDDIDVCAQIGGAGALRNDFSTGDPANANDIILGVSTGASSMRLPGYGGTTLTNVQTFVLGNNNFAGTVVSAYVDAPATAANFTGGAACTPPIAMLPNSNEFFAQHQVESSPMARAEASSPNMNPADRFNTPLGDPGMVKQAAWVMPQAESVEAVPAIFADNPGGNITRKFVPPSAPAQLGPLDPDPIVIGSLPAGKSVFIKFRVTVNDPLPLGTIQISNQGTVSSNELADVLTDDTAVGGAADPTLTPVDRPDTSVVSLTRQSANPNRNATVTWQIVFANPVDGLSTSNFSLVPGGSVTGASIGSVTETSGPPATTWNISANTGTGDGTLELRLANDTGLSHDVTNQPYTEPANGAVYTIDKTAPTVSSILRQSPASNPTNADILVFRVTFNEAVTGVGANSFVATGTTTTVDPSVSAVTPNLVFDFSVNGSLDGNLNNLNGTVGLNVSASPTITDLAGNTLAVVEPSPASNDQTYTVDNTAPAVTNVTSTAANGNYTTGALIPVTITFNEVVTVTGSPQLTLETGATDRVVNYGSGSGSNTLTFTYTVQAGDTSSDLDYVGTTALALNGGTIRDAATNNANLTLPAPSASGSLGFNKAIVIDTTAPAVTNVTSTAANGSYATGAVIPISVTFSEPVVVTGTPQLTLETGATDRVVNYGSGSGTATLTFSYTVQAGDTSADLDYVTTTSLGLNGGLIRDAATNNASLTLPAPGAAGSLGDNKAIVIDTTAPAVTNVTSTAANGSYGTGALIPVTITFNEAVTVTGTPQLTLETGATDRVVNYSSGSGTNTLTFNYTTQAGDTSSDLDYIGTTALALNGGTIRDAALNNASLTLPAPGASGSLGFNKDIVLDATEPAVTNVTSPKTNGAYTIGEVIPVTITFSEVVTVTGTPQLTLETGATDAVVNYTSGSGSNTLTFNYTVQAGDTSSDLDYVGTTSLALNGGTIRDGSSNNATLTLAAPGATGSLGLNKNIVIDTTAPAVTNVTSPKANGAYTSGEVISVTVTFNEVVTVIGTPQLTLETGATDAVVNYSSGSGSNTLTFNYTVQAGDTSTDLDYVNTTSLALNGGTIRDAATNNAGLTLATPGATGSLGFNKAIVIDTTAPAVTNVTSTAANGSYTTGAVIPVTVTFSEAVTVTGTPQLTLETGATDAVVNYSSGSGSNTLTFNYTVAPGNNSSDLDYVSTTSLALNGGTIRDVSLNDASLTLASPGATGSLGFNKAIVIDTTAPAVTNVTSTKTDGTYTSGEVISVTVTFNEVVTVIGTPQLTLETGATDAVVNYSSGSGSNTLTFNYTVQAGDTSTDLDYVNTTSLVLNGGTITDAASNNASLTLATPGAAGSLGANKAIVIDTTAPAVTNVTSTAANGSYTTGAVIPVTVTFSEAVTVTGTPQLTLETGATDAVVNYSSGSGSNILTFNYTVAPGNNSSDLDYVSTTSLALNGGTIRDVVGTSAGLTLPAPGASGSLGANKAIVIDTVAPDTSIDAPTPTNPTNNTSATFIFSGTDNLTAPASLTFECKLDSGSFTACTSPQNYPGPLAEGSHTFQVRASDSAANPDPTPASFTWVVDTIAPTATMTSTTTNPTNISPIPVTVQFSEPVTGFDATLDVTPGNATVGNFVIVDGDTYTFDLTPLGQGAVTASIAPGTYSDPVGNFNTTTANFSRTFDSVSPTVTLSSAAPNPTNTSPIPVTVTFSESVTGFTAADISAGNGTVSNFAGSGSGYTFDLLPNGIGLVTADIVAGVAQDVASNPNTAAIQFSRTFVGPEIALLGNNTVINNGDTSPSSTDQTDFGSVALGGAITRTFTISNSGGATLNLSGSPLVALSGPAAGDFSVVANPVTPVISNTSTTFQVRFNPTVAGTRAATITIANNDSNENPYTFAIAGTGIRSSVAVYLPLVLKDVVATPDLIIVPGSLVARSNNVTLQIQNVGNAAVTDAFWLDVYFNPNQTPSLNKRWQDIAPAGAVWGVSGAGLSQLTPGGTLTLTTGDAFYFAQFSTPPPLPVGANVFALPDSVNFNTSYGAVQESNEANNLFGPVISTANSGSVGVQPAGGPAPEGLPPRE